MSIPPVFLSETDRAPLTCRESLIGTQPENTDRKEHMMIFEECVEALVALSARKRPVTNAAVDDLVDGYLVGFGVQTATKRDELARAFRDRATVSRRRENIWERVLRNPAA
jgi:hypothetical protein